ncbi:MAG: S1C family serine protease, partial [Planctomycetota bacterium]
MRASWNPCALLLAAALGVLAVSLRPARADGDPEARRSPIVRAIERSRHAIVAIHTTQIIERHLYGFELPPVEGKGIGSGTIFHPGGYVITNAHVLNRASEVLVDVTLEGGETLTHEAGIFAVDVPNDLAILRLLRPEKGEPLPAYPFLRLGRSNDLMIGESVIGVGNPFGIGTTVTTGVIGALDRTLRFSGSRQNDEEIFDDFIQIDAALNPGNSGGPLLDVTGRWIGVNTAIWNRRLDAEGIGFAIPVDRVRSLVGRAFKRRLMTGDWLGIELEEGEGGQARVRYVFPKGPAHGSDLRPGDILTRVNGEPTPTLFDLRWQMA